MVCDCELGFRQKSGSGSPTVCDQIRSDSLAHTVLLRSETLSAVSAAPLRCRRLFLQGKMVSRANLDLHPVAVGRETSVGTSDREFHIREFIISQRKGP